MHSTGIEPVLPPWKGGILPLNYECCTGITQSYCRLFFTILNAFIIYAPVTAGHPLESPPPSPPASGTEQLSPLQIPSQVKPFCRHLLHSSRNLSFVAVLVVAKEKKYSSLPSFISPSSGIFFN